MNAQSTRDRILRGAERALIAHGLDACSVQQILAEAGVSRRTFYQYFRSKDDIVHALYKERVEGLIDDMRRSVDERTDPIQRVTAAIDTYLAYQVAGGPLKRAMQAKAMSQDSPMAPDREKTLDAMVELMHSNVEAVLAVKLDPYVYRALLLGAEGLVLNTQARTGGFTEADRARIRNVMVPSYFAVLAQHANMPKLDEA
ncbi:MAG TPA: TetR/AcrR family transcriptional regulator [Myxococcota bacterium]|nr:TetR/AcrR family transcriptional regulator [Myxococcota bacterium]